jgi:pre-mRNA-splicing factor ATP-dependent RNA helicase DHX38/PRP16
MVLFLADTKTQFLDGRVVFTKQGKPVMPLKDPTSDMTIIALKGSVLVQKIREKESQCFWDLVGSNLGIILGVERTSAR